MTIAAIEDSLVSTTSTATDVSSKVTILDAVRFVAKSWRQVKAQTIANCFRKGGFRVVAASEEGAESGEAASLEAEEEPVLPEVVNGESYLRIDEDIQCFNDEDVLEDDIVEAVSSKRLRQSEDGSEDEDSDPDEEVAKTTHAAARRSVQLLQRYFVEQGVSDEYHAAIDMCADEVFRRANAKMKQTSLDSFMSRL